MNALSAIATTCGVQLDSSTPPDIGAKPRDSTGRCLHAFLWAVALPGGWASRRAQDAL
jgi:hypothetical protein